MDRLKELQEKRLDLAKAMRSMHDEIDGQDDGWTVEQRETWDKNQRQILDIDKDIEDLKRDAERVAFAKQLVTRSTDPNEPMKVGTRTMVDADDRPITRHDYDMAKRAWMLPDHADPKAIEAAKRCDLALNSKVLQLRSPAAVATAKSRKEIRDAYEEQRALGTDTPTAGGNTVPDEMMAQIDIAMLHFNTFRQFSTIYRNATGAQMPLPTNNDTANKGAIVAENNDIGEQDTTFGQVVFTPYMYSSKMVRVSYQLIQDANFNMDLFLGRILGERIGRIQGEHHATGSGTGQPQGLITAAPAASGLTIGAPITYDNLVDLKYSVDRAYRSMAGWVMSDALLAQVVKITATATGPIWQPNIAADVPGTILGDPYYINNEIPSTGSSAKVIAYGALDKYTVVEATQVIMNRLVERYAEFYQVGFNTMHRSDAKLVDAGTNPVKSGTLAA